MLNAEVLKAISQLAWPAIVILIIFLFRRPIMSIIETAKSREFTVKVGGQELTFHEANTQQQSLIADLQAQVIEIQKVIAEKPKSLELVNEVFGNDFGEGEPRLDVRSTPIEEKGRFGNSAARKTLLKGEFMGTPAPAQTHARPPIKPMPSNLPLSGGGGTVLWVDDNPKNNSYLIQQLVEKGIKVQTALSTTEGLKEYSKNPYSLVISDMGRVESGAFRATAGFELFKEIHKMSPETPFIVYCSGRGVRENATEAASLGVTAITSSATELMGYFDEYGLA